MMSKIVFVVLAMCIAQSFAETCNPICTRELKPVCGMDNTGNQQTFSNLCLLEFESCSNRGAGWKVLADGQCATKTDSEVTCNGICTRIYNPVCGIDNTGNKRTFSNKCVFESEECNNRGAGWKILAENKCEAVQEVAVEDVPKCPQFCTFEYKPVCGVDNTGNMRTFGNKCGFESIECNNRGAGWKLLANDACEVAQAQDEAPRHGCNRMCTFEYSPVCAIDNTGNMQTFGNKCTFEAEECMNRGAGWKLLADNACEAVQVRDETPKCNQMCTFMYSPVCAVDNTGNMRTFGNKCTFESEECMNRGAGWKLLANNACEAVQVQDETPKCNQFCTFEYSPVCAVDNTGNMRTFGNKCTFDSEECMNRGAGWKLLANNECSEQLEVEEDEENCPKVCTLEYMPICGMDNFGNTRTFSNKCGFNMAQCFNRGAGWKIMSMDQC